MHQLFTFNSQQLQTVKVNPHNCSPIVKRKSIINCKSAKKPSSSAQINKQINSEISQKYSRRSPFKKVTFNQPNPSICLELGNPSLLQNIKPIDIDNSEQFISQLSHLIPEIQRQNLTAKQPNRKRKRIVLRSFSAVSHIQVGKPKLRDSQINTPKIVENSYCRDRRILSLKMNPKVVVPISNRKLPKAFRINLGQNKIPSQTPVINRKNKINSEFMKCCDLQLLQGNIGELQGIFRFKKIMQLQNRLLSKLFLPSLK